MNLHKISFKISRGTAALGLFVIGLAAIVAAAQRPASAQAMAVAAGKFLDGLTPDQRKAGDVRARFRRAYSLEFHSDDDVSAQRTADQIHDGAAA